MSGGLLHSDYICPMVPVTTMTGNVAPSGITTYTNVDIISFMDGDGAFLHAPSIIDLQRQYQNETRRELSLSLHLITLGEYFKLRRIPRGMRSQPQDSAFSGDMDYRTKFEAISNKFAFDLILLNLEFLQKDIAAVRARIHELRSSLKAALPEEDFERFIQKQSTFLQKLRTDLESTKRHKWQRDSVDYAEGKVYLWDKTPEEWGTGGSLHKRTRRGGRRHKRSNKDKAP